MEDYKQRLIELGKEAKTALEKCPNIAIRDDEKIFIAKINHLLGFIEALEVLEKD